MFWLATLAHLSPIARLVTSVNPSMPTKTFGSGLLGSHGFWFYFPVWTSFLALLLISKLKYRPRDPAEAAIEPAPLPAPLSPADEGEGGVSETVIAKTVPRAGTVSVKIGSSTSVQSLDVSAVEKAQLVAAETAPMPAVEDAGNGTTRAAEAPESGTAPATAAGSDSETASGTAAPVKPDTATVMMPGGSSATAETDAVDASSLDRDAGGDTADASKPARAAAETASENASETMASETMASETSAAAPGAPETDSEPVLGTPGAETIPLTADAVAAAEAELERSRRDAAPSAPETGDAAGEGDESPARTTQAKAGEEDQ